jgi:hypothetical protein
LTAKRNSTAQEALDGLFALPPERFVPERDTLARRLRDEGDRELAAEVKSQRKPTRAAWVVNQLARRRGDEMAGLLRAGSELRQAQGRLLAGKGERDDLRSASERERAALASLVGSARDVLSEEGQQASEELLERVRQTLHAAALDEGFAEAVGAGRVDREREPAEFAGLEGPLGAPPPRPKRRPAERKAKPRPAPKEREVDEGIESARAAEEAEQRRVEEAESAVEEAKARRAAAREALTRARRAEADAVRAVEHATADQRLARDKLKQARERTARLRERRE